MVPQFVAPVMLDETDSTNTYVREHFDSLPDGVLVTARFQTAGRGRLGRKWVAPPGSSLLGTFALKQVRDGFHAGCLVGLAALAAVRRAAPGLDVYLKWPNDLYIGRAKLAGLLGEGVLRSGRLIGVAEGIGLNVNADSEALAGVGQSAVSLKVAAGREFNPVFLANSLAKSLIEYYIIYLTSFDGIFAAWRRENRLIGRDIALIGPDNRRYEGKFRDVTAAGELVLDTATERRVFNCGDVSIDKKSL